MQTIYYKTNPIRIFYDSKDVWFCCVDICRCFNIRWQKRKMLNNLNIRFIEIERKGERGDLPARYNLWFMNTESAHIFLDRREDNVLANNMKNWIDHFTNPMNHCANILINHKENPFKPGDNEQAYLIRKIAQINKKII